MIPSVNADVFRLWANRMEAINIDKIFSKD